MSNTHLICPVCQEQRSREQLVPGMAIRPSIQELIKRDHPVWNERMYLCTTDLDLYRNKYIEQILTDERGELSRLDRTILSSIASSDSLVQQLQDEKEDVPTFGQQLADKVASFGGSWTFILLFAAILVGWIGLNVYMMSHAFDPYPFILLNLLLSCLAAIQAPVIMMSQNRQEAKDRKRAEHDFAINLKAELEIRALHEKMDHVLIRQWERLLEIQQIQMEMLEEIRENNSGPGKV